MKRSSATDASHTRRRANGVCHEDLKSVVDADAALLSSGCCGVDPREAVCVAPEAVCVAPEGCEVRGARDDVCGSSRRLRAPHLGSNATFCASINMSEEAGGGMSQAQLARKALEEAKKKAEETPEEKTTSELTARQPPAACHLRCASVG